MGFEHIRFSLPALWGDSKRWRFKVRGDLVGAGIGAGAGVLTKKLIWGDKGGALATIGAGLLGGGLGYMAGGYLTDKINRGKEARRVEKAKKLIDSTKDADKKEFYKQLLTVPENYKEHVSGSFADANMDNAVNSLLSDEMKAHGVDPSLVPIYDFPKNKIMVTDSGGNYSLRAHIGSPGKISSTFGLSMGNPDTLLMTPLANSTFRYGPGRYTLAKKVLAAAVKSREGTYGDLKMTKPADALLILQDSDKTPWMVPDKKGIEGHANCWGFNDDDSGEYMSKLLGLSDKNKDALTKNTKLVSVYNSYIGPNKLQYNKANIRGVLDEELGHAINAVTHDSDKYAGKSGTVSAFNPARIYEQGTNEFNEGLSAIKSMMHRMKDAKGRYMFSTTRPVTDAEAFNFVLSGDFQKELTKQRLYEYNDIAYKAEAVANLIRGKAHYGEPVSTQDALKSRSSLFRLFDSIAANVKRNSGRQLA